MCTRLSFSDENRIHKIRMQNKIMCENNLCVYFERKKNKKKIYLKSKKKKTKRNKFKALLMNSTLIGPLDTWNAYTFLQMCIQISLVV